MPTMRDEQKARTREEIIRAAATEFARVGFAGASIASIAAVMGRPKSAIGYHQFTSKQDLADAVIDRQWTTWVDLLARAAEAMPAGLPRLISVMLTTAVDSRTDPVTLATVRLLTDPSLEPSGTDRPFRWRDYAAEQIAASIEQGELVVEVDAMTVMTRLLNAGFGVYEAENRGLQPIDTERALRAVWTDLLSGLDPAHGADLIRRSLVLP